MSELSDLENLGSGSGEESPAEIQEVSDARGSDRAAGSPLAAQGAKQGRKRIRFQAGSGYDSDSSESVDLPCMPCGASSKDNCPIGLKSDPKIERRIIWGKTAARVKIGKAGRRKKVLRACGCWCRICINIFRVRFQHRMGGQQGQTQGQG